MQSSHEAPIHTRHTGPLAFWFNTPLFIRIMIGLAIGVTIGLVFHPKWAGDASPVWLLRVNFGLTQLAWITLRVLNALAPALILLAVMRALIGTHIEGSKAARLIYLLLLNTVVAICVGLIVANVMHPGVDTLLAGGKSDLKPGDPVENLLKSVPSSILSPLVEGNSIGVILVALAFGLAARKLPDDKKQSALHAINIAFDLVVHVLYWVLELVPFAVLGKVGSIITMSGFSPFQSLGRFVIAVLLALLLQSCYYLLRLRLLSWVRPLALLRGARDALVMAFSTDSSAATMPLTFECMVKKVGLREENASLGVLVGGNFNHDGTALYQAMSTLFIAQLSGVHLTLWHQFLVVVTGVISSVGMAGIPEAGLVTMALIFNAVGLRVDLIAILLPVDWFLDRCRTTINVLGDTSVACLLDGRKKAELVAGKVDA